MAEAAPVTAYHDKPVIPLYGVPRDYMPKGKREDWSTYSQSNKDFNQLLPRFGGKDDDNVGNFIKAVDQAMANMGLSSKGVATALRSINSTIHDRAATFLNLTLKNPRKYPRADHWCQQRFQPGRAWIPYIAGQEEQVAIDESVSTIDSLAESIETQPSIASVAENVEGGPIAGVHGLEARRADPRTQRRHHHPRQEGVHRQPHIPRILERPDQPFIPQLEEVVPNQCLRHYIYHEFYQTANRDAAHKKLEAARFQQSRMSVREYIWNLSLAYENYKEARWGVIDDAKREADRDNDEDYLTNIIKNHSIQEFKNFFQQKLTSNHNCMDTVELCLDMAKDFEIFTDPGKLHTAKCSSNAKVHPIMALKEAHLTNPGRLATGPQAPGFPGDPGNAASATYNAAYYTETGLGLQGPISNSQQPPSFNPLTYLDQSGFNVSAAGAQPPTNLPPIPAHLTSQMTEEAWSAAVTAGINLNQQAQQAAKIAAALSQPPPPAPRGGGRGNRGRGNRGNRGGTNNRGGKAGGQTPPVPPPPNVVPEGYKDTILLSAQQEAKCIHPNPQGRERCTYCLIVGHGYSLCGYKREDVKANNHWPLHPKRGQLLPKKKQFARYMASQRKTFSANSANPAAAVSFSQFTMDQQQQQTPPPPPPPPSQPSQENAELQAQVQALQQKLQQQHQVAAVVPIGVHQAGVEAAASVENKPRPPGATGQGGCTPKPTRPPIQPPVIPPPILPPPPVLPPLPVLPPNVSPEEKMYMIRNWQEHQQVQQQQLLQNHSQAANDEAFLWAHGND